MLVKIELSKTLDPELLDEITRHYNPPIIASFVLYCEIELVHYALEEPCVLEWKEHLSESSSGEEEAHSAIRVHSHSSMRRGRL